MNLEEKLRQLRNAAQKTTRDLELERQLDYLRRLEPSPRRLPAERVPHGIEEYVEGLVERNERGEYFVARQGLPFGRPYGKLRVSDLSAADLSPLDLLFESTALPDPSRLVYLDTETTGLAGGTGTCAFLIGLGAIEGSQFAVRQFFVRDYPEEKAVLAALADVLTGYEGIVTFNGKTFDLPLLETRYALARMKSPFARLLHLDLLHPARQVWKLRLESCQLTNLEKEVLKIRRQGDVNGSEIPQIYFDYLRTGNARGLQPVFYHNALDIITLAGLTVEMARLIGAGCAEGAGGAVEFDSNLDLFGLSRLYQRHGALDRSVEACRRALRAGLPQSVEPRALWQLASQHKRRREYEAAAAIWVQLTLRDDDFTIAALEELAIHYEHRRRDAPAALSYVEAALNIPVGRPGGGVGGGAGALSPRHRGRFLHRLSRLRRKQEKLKV
ncbi:MAG TPA: ribonuclease H-like domain-containing protein [Terriglobia bacterium]|nr:ribonuclease H-like domain-containing protein [Terriglobia bacterium]